MAIKHPDYSKSWNETYGLNKDPVRQNLIFPLIKERVIRLNHTFIADLGCGNGSMIRNLLEVDFNKLHGIDINTAFLEYAKRAVNDDRVIIERGDIIRENPIRTGSTDIALAIFVLNEIEEIVPFFAQSRRILSPLGRLLIVMTHPFVPLYWKILEDNNVAINEKVPGFSDYFKYGEYHYKFTISKDFGKYCHYNLAMIQDAINKTDMRIIELRELTTDDQAFNQIPEYLRTKDIPKFLYLEVGR